MNNLLIFFAFPVAVIIISVILQRQINSPISVAALTFAIFLIITFSAFNETFLIATIIYTIISYISALVTKIIDNRNDEDTSIISNNSTCGCNRYRRY